MTSNAPIPPPLPPHQAQALDYRGPYGPGADPAALAQRRTNAIFSLVRFICAMAVMLFLLLIFLTVIPRFERVFADFGTKLPLITQIVLDISRFLQTPLGWVAAAVIACIVGVTVAVLPIPRRWLRLLVIFVLAMVVISLALAVFLPMIELIDNISAGKK
jgi:type II secretory pathway component PulF